jgi:hypothetical protein
MHPSDAPSGDDAYFNERPANAEAIVFRWSGGSYAIRIACANPIGNPVALPEPPPPSNYDLTPSASVPVSVAPGSHGE